VTGQRFRPDHAAPAERVPRNLRAAGILRP
jgi:hypothetical protein